MYLNYSLHRLLAVRVILISLRPPGLSHTPFYLVAESVGAGG